MAGVAGRPFNLYAWGAFTWPNAMRYSPASFAALSFSGSGSVRTSTVTIAGAAAPGSKIGLLYGKQAYNYDSKTRLVAGPSASISLRELSPATVYHVAAYGISGDGTTYLGADTLLTIP
jgi:hypothetical protein